MKRQKWPENQKLSKGDKENLKTRKERIIEERAAIAERKRIRRHIERENDSCDRAGKSTEKPFAFTFNANTPKAKTIKVKACGLQQALDKAKKVYAATATRP